MNIENAKKLVSQLKRLPDEKFWMPVYILHPEEMIEYGIIPKKHLNCGTIGCIAGWAQMFNGPRACSEPAIRARKWLGLREQEALSLFVGAFSRKRMDQITRTDAIAELNRLIAEAERVPA